MSKFLRRSSIILTCRLRKVCHPCPGPKTFKKYRFLRGAKLLTRPGPPHLTDRPRLHLFLLYIFIRELFILIYYLYLSTAIMLSTVVATDTWRCGSKCAIEVCCLYGFFVYHILSCCFGSIFLIILCIVVCDVYFCLIL
jgi:hypothetical protein